MCHFHFMVRSSDGKIWGQGIQKTDNKLSFDNMKRGFMLKKQEVGRVLINWGTRFRRFTGKPCCRKKDAGKSMTSRGGGGGKKLFLECRERGSGG